MVVVRRERNGSAMNEEQYKYDVAFSFLAVDESLATQLNDLLQDRLETFLYSRRQGEIAGTDGEKSFNAVFGEQSRVVVVLYRSGWGETPWTRIEETAIRSRAYDHGYSFVIFIPLEDSPSVPKWLPRTQLWIGLKRWGVEGAASVIEARVQELGGQPHEESVLDRAARLQRSLDFASRRKQFLNSDKGVSAAKSEFEILKTEIKRLAEQIVCQTPGVSLRTKAAPGQLVILGLGLGLSVEWDYRYANSLDGSRLKVSLWEGHPPFPGVMPIDEPRQRRSLVFNFDLMPDDRSCWIASREPESRAYATADLAAFILKYMMEHGDPSRDRR